MKVWLRRLAVAAEATAVVCLMGVALTGQAAAQPTPIQAASGKTAGEVFKNVTTSTLKGLTTADFMGAMGVMTAALAFDCSDCHTGAGTDKVVWEFDTERKKTARKMVEMVANINRANFSGVQLVTCWTCHHGRSRPATTISLDALYGPPNEEKDDIVAPGQGVPTATQILDKYIQALGGAQKVNSLTSWVATGTQGGYQRVRGGGQFQIVAKAPNRRAVLITFKEAKDRGDQARVFDGMVGWVNVPRSVLGEYQVTGSELDGMRADAELSFPGRIKQVLTNLRSGFPDSIDGKEVDVVQGNSANGLLVTLYFDKKSGLLTRELRYSKSPIGRISTQVDYADYRDVNGIKFPFSYTFVWLDGKDAFTISDVKVNVPIDDAKFGKPSGGTTH
ncbi:MAG TPA: photosynthetic reaction center cytochrome c subunit family protein [Bryobacteraceae bacterium]|nr:photosynthetic reaction center cytochrome c subunit family protein [Bryobacteraceae bacterium]